MNWIKVTDQLPPVDAAGESEYVLASAGGRFIPKVVKYSNGECSQKGWYTTRMGEHIPFTTGKKGQKRHLTFTHWAKIEYPQD